MTLLLLVTLFMMVASLLISKTLAAFKFRLYIGSIGFSFIMNKLDGIGLVPLKKIAVKAIDTEQQALASLTLYLKLHDYFVISARALVRGFCKMLKFVVP